MVEPLLIEHEDGVDRVTLNRPDSLNALDPSLIDALNAYFESLQRNRKTRVVMLKGAGQAFCAGLDLKHAMARRAGELAVSGFGGRRGRRAGGRGRALRRCDDGGLAGEPAAVEGMSQHERRRRLDRGVIAMEDRNQVLCSRSEDFSEGIRAFLKKRKPVYISR